MRGEGWHHGYETPWCEPRQLVVNVLDQQGRVDRTILPLYDATQDNADGMKRILEACAEMDRGLLFANLIDFDMRFGHRRNPEGYAGALREFDAFLPELTSTMDERDLLIITADHGNDPTWPGTDHTREHVPLIAWRPGMSGGIDLGVRETFADVGATLSEALSVPPPQAGTSFLPLLID